MAKTDLRSPSDSKYTGFTSYKEKTKVDKPKIKKAIKVAKAHPLDQTSLDIFGVTYNQLNLLQEQVVLGAAGKKE